MLLCCLADALPKCSAAALVHHLTRLLIFLLAPLGRRPHFQPSQAMTAPQSRSLLHPPRQPRPGEPRRWRRWGGRNRRTAVPQRAPLPGCGFGSPVVSGFFLVFLKSAHPRAWRGTWRGGGRGKWPIMWGTRHAQLTLFFQISTNLANFSGPRVYVVPGRRLFPLEEEGEKSRGFGRPSFAPFVCKPCSPEYGAASVLPSFSALEPRAGLGIRVSRMACIYPPCSEQQNRNLIVYLWALYGCRKCEALPKGRGETAVLYRSSVAVGLGAPWGPFQQSCSIPKQWRFS